MNTNEKLSKKLITHNGSFHSDDIFACATLCMMLEKNNQQYEIIRTRDEKIIKDANREDSYVFDIGGIYDEKENRFDHHQVGGAGKRVSSDGQTFIEYSSFGLVWKKFGKTFTNSSKVMEMVEKRLVMPVDAFDVGIDLVENKYEVRPYYIQHFFMAMKPTWKEENKNVDEIFLKCVEIAKEILKREIIQAEDIFLAEKSVINIYENARDKRIIILDKNYPSEIILNNYPEPLFVVYPRSADGFWGVKAIGEDPRTFVNRKNLPKLWAGLRDEELVNVTGVGDAVFCHRGLFLAVAKTKEGAMKLAQIAVES